MWDFNEKDIESYLKNSKIISIDWRKYRVINTQYEVTIPQKVEVKPHQLAILEELEEVFVEVSGKKKRFDLLTYKYPKKPSGRDNEVVIFEIKKSVATLSDVAQLQQYLNLFSLLVTNNIDHINKKLHLRSTYKVRGFLLAKAIPVSVWFATSDHLKKRPDIELFAYTVKASLHEKAIQSMSYLNFSRHYMKEFKRNTVTYKKLLKYNQLDNK